MVKFRFEAILEFDEEGMYDRNEPSEVEWFNEILMDPEYGPLILYSNEIGDAVGDVTILKYERFEE